MEYKFNLGVFIGFIIAGACSMIGPSQYIGIAILALAVIFGFLFVYRKSPVKKYWWSASDKLMIMAPQTQGFKAKTDNKRISVGVELVSWSGIIVEKVVIKIGRRMITSFEWKSHEVMEREVKFLDFIRPSWLGAGEYEAKVIAYTPEGYSKSRQFILEIPAPPDAILGG